MIELFWGNDLIKKRKALETAIDALIKKNPHLQVFEYDTENFSAEILKEVLYSQSLFGGMISIFYDVFSKEEIEIQARELLKKISNSPHAFFFVEEIVPKKTIDDFKKQGAKICSFEKKETKKSPFPVFSITDSVGARDKKRAWIVLQEAFREGIAPEHIHGILHWQFKNMNIVKNYAQDTGLSPFVFTKTKKAALLYSEEELKRMSSDLMSLYHNAHRGGAPLDLALEKFVLSL